MPDSASVQQQAARARLARVLRTLRLDSGRSGEQLASALGWSQSKVSKIERERTRPSGSDAEVWLQACEADAATRAEVVELVEAALVDARHWRAAHHEGLARRQREVGYAEERASRICSFQPDLVPGLLQTADYAREVLTLADISGQRDIAAAVAERLRRQEVLYRETTRFEFVLTEAALLWHAEDSRLLLPQLDRVLSVGTLPNVGVRVFPLGVPFGHAQLHGFLLYEEETEPWVLVETYTRELILTDADELATYRSIHQSLTEYALPEDESREFLHTLRRRVGSQG
ncbi:helix-turn-helix protein [Haloactinospora alba]|uniref:Helix-turn-helix protein n=1 Tax=Haloactinospora alba TaxID=405555 RepID=A0A543NK73_9ACTN|nr:helix-turn-helix transcriptional regulator [Haloactinospora alba]TQN32217.1 helix-turn-helix protein [Haloactinospora alba]